MSIIKNTINDTKTFQALRLILNDFKKLFKFFKYASLVFTSAYFIFAFITDIGNKIANIVLASLFVTYTLFDLITSRFKIKKTKKIVKRSYKWLRLLTNAFTLGSMLYGIYTATTNVSAIAIIIATLMIILWVLQLFLEIAIEVFEDKWEFISNSFRDDMENIKTIVWNNVKESVSDKVKETTKNVVNTVIREPAQKISKKIEELKNKRENKKQTEELDETKKIV